MIIYLNPKHLLEPDHLPEPWSYTWTLIIYLNPDQLPEPWSSTRTRTLNPDHLPVPWPSAWTLIIYLNPDHLPEPWSSTWTLTIYLNPDHLPEPWSSTWTLTICQNPDHLPEPWSSTWALIIYLNPDHLPEPWSSAWTLIIYLKGKECKDHEAEYCQGHDLRQLLHRVQQSVNDCLQSWKMIRRQNLCVESLEYAYEAIYYLCSSLDYINSRLSCGSMYNLTLKFTFESCYTTVVIANKRYRSALHTKVLISGHGNLIFWMKSAELEHLISIYTVENKLETKCLIKSADPGTFALWRIRYVFLNLIIWYLSSNEANSMGIFLENDFWPPPLSILYMDIKWHES